MNFNCKYPLNTLAVAVIFVCFGSISYAEESSEDDAIDLGQVTVLGERDAKSHDEKHNQVYDRSISSVYRDKTEVERFKGAVPADIFKGMVGVNSGDARNSGALDPNIRGIQGQGRVPVTIDGTEQAITVWRGYAGANNRNYIDPMLIGGMTVEKGPALSRGVNSSVGGSVAITTLGINDIVPEDENWGIDLKVEGSNNSITPNMPNINAPLPNILGSSTNIPYLFSFYDNATAVTPRTSGQNAFGTDQAIRLAAGKKWNDFDLLGVYVYRKKGNHFSGRNGAGRYSGGEYNKENAAERKDFWDNYTKHLADVYQPGSEVPNTSNEMQSLLLKGTWHPTDAQALELGLRHTWGKYGEIMPSRVANHLSDLDHLLNTSPENPMKDYVREQVVGKFPQWPLSTVKTTAVYLNHKWNPENKFIDLETNIWGTKTILDTHTSGGYPREFYSSFLHPELSGKWRNTSLTNSDNRRWGITTSNKMELTDKLDLTLGGSYQYEKLNSKDIWYYDPKETQGYSFRTIPREGWRKEWNMNFNFDWQPTSWLDLSAGMQKQGYSSYDEQLNRQRKARNQAYASKGAPGLLMNYELAPTQELLDAHAKFTAGRNSNDSAERTKAMREYMTFVQNYNRELAEKGISAKVPVFYDPESQTISGDETWYVREDGKFHEEDNPFRNGKIESIGGKPKANANYTHTNRPYEGDPFAEVPKQSNSGTWQPVLAATVWVSDNARFYARYAKTQRMPSMFESTVGFSANPIYLGTGLKPEKSTNIEVGYVHDLSELLDADRYADVKIAWFKNTIKDVIDRDQFFSLRNIDKQIVSGLEFQSRYDNGRFFADFSASYFLKNKVCDNSTAISMDPYYGRINSCVKDGFYNSYLRNMTPPKYALNLTLGGRFYDDRLELGTRLLHHAGSKNTDKENFGDIAPWQTNVPVHWAKATTVDAWVNYKFDKNTSLEVVATNLTNQYYLDPLTRSHFPAPGRTIRVGFNIKF